VLIIAFSTLYGIISLQFGYYGELITYAGMSLPMAVIALISWLRNPYKGNRSQVEINKVSRREIVFALFLTLAVTLVMFFALYFLGTKNLWVSTFSVSTSFLAVYLTARRSPYFALAYALNDVVLISLWVLACFEDISYMSTVICFAAFLLNDIYGFTNWKLMQKQQAKNID
jgi:nicotinamide mononucleotide transporter PnuC